MQKLFEDTIKKYNMLSDSCSVIVAVSGGADSVALLSLLSECNEISKDRLLVVHVEHGIRGEDSLRDAEYVEKLCDELGIACHTHHIKVLEEVKKTGETVEEAARRIRYELLQMEASELSVKCSGEVKIAVAHHQYDQVETVLMNLVRGSHLKGLTGMRPVNGNIIRPLLYCRKEDIEKYLTEKNIAWHMDSTNNDIEYTRNLIRHEILPLLEKINSKATEHIVSTADELRDIEEYFSAETEALYEKYVPDNWRKESSFDKNKLLIKNELLTEENCGQELVNRVIYKAITDMAGRAKDIEREHIASVKALFDKQVGRGIDLPYQLRARRDYEGVSISRIVEANEAVEQGEAVDLIKAAVEFVISSANERLSLNEKKEACGYEMTLLAADDVGKIEKKEYTKYFDYDIMNAVVLRTPREGDFIIIDSDGHTKSLHKYLKDEKVSYEDREHVEVFADGNHVIWVRGYRISEAYKVTSKTKRVLKIEYRGRI